MIIYGTKSSNLKNGQIRNVTCPNCETETSMTFSAYRKYAHIYWIPFFPVKKITVAECHHCHKTYEFHELPQPIQKKILKDNEMHPVRTPVWMFSGIFLIAALVTLGFYTSGQTEKNENAYIKNPKIGDVYYYEYDTVPNYYSAFRVDKVTKDSVYFTMNDMMTDQQSGVDDIDVAKNYTTAKYASSKKTLVHLHDTDTIFTIKRNE